MKRSASMIFAGFLLWSTGLSATAAETSNPTARYAYQKTIERTSNDAEDIVAVRLDADIYAAAIPEKRNNAGQIDLCIFDEVGKVVPSKIEQLHEMKTEKTREINSTKILSVKEEGETFEIVVERPKNSPAADGMIFRTPRIDFERKIGVEGLSEDEPGKPLVADGVIFDYSRFVDVRRNEIALPKNDFRQFKIILRNMIEQRESNYKELTRTLRTGKEESRTERTSIVSSPFRIDGIDLFSLKTIESVRRAVETDYPIAHFKIERDEEKKETVISIETKGEPLTSFTLETPSRNFQRRATVRTETETYVENRGSKLGPQRILQRNPSAVLGEATLYKIQFRNIHEEKLTVSFPETRSKEFKIILADGDNPPIDISGIKAIGNVYRALFLAEKDKTYRACYGSETTEPPHYETSIILDRLRGDITPAEATLGIQEPNVAYAQEPFDVQKWFASPLFLTSAIIVMVAVLGFALYHAARRIETLPKEEHEG